MTQLSNARTDITRNHLRDEAAVLTALRADTPFPEGWQARTQTRAVALVNGIRHDSEPGLMEVFLAEYGLSTKEGIALMCLAEALLRVPDAETMDELIEDKIAPSAWGEHLGHSSSSLVNASTWALMLTGKVLQDGQGLAAVLRGAVRRLGEPVIRVAAGRAMKEMGQQFVLGQTIKEAVKRGAPNVKRGYSYSYDMLGEAALTAADARSFYDAYADAITALAPQCTSDDIRNNPGISVKLSALHPRYEFMQRERVLAELVPATLKLAQMAAKAGMGFNIDAEEAARLDLSLDVIEAVLRDPSLAGWDGFGVVVQAYGKRAAPVIDWLHALAEELDRKVMVRLVKGAYWDTEIKLAQVEGLADFPVFTRKVATDVSYLCCARRLLQKTDRIYPQFATHNAQSVAAILEMAEDVDAFEFQRLHGMGDALHDLVLKEAGTRCRIYAPVGAHQDLLAYLVRRLLENGANSSFVNQIVDENVPAEVVAADPIAGLESAGSNSAVIAPIAIYGAERPNSKGWDLNDAKDVQDIKAARAPHQTTSHVVKPRLVTAAAGGETYDVLNPGDPRDQVGEVTFCNAEDAQRAVADAAVWAADAVTRAQVLNRAADLYEENFGAFFALLAREAGKTQMDAIAELREAVDFLRYYAARGQEHTAEARGLFTCISPWNFPLAIFTGQIAAALAAGNGVLAKPAETTCLTADLAVSLLHDAGVPVAALQLLPGRGTVLGPVLTQLPEINGVCFTGSTATAQTINRGMAAKLAPDAPLIAETGGLNAMIVDSTALPEQAVKDIVASAFQSAGQRCSALRMLYVQEDVAEDFLTMLYGAMDAQIVGNPWELTTDIGPVISEAAASGINAHISKARARGQVLKQLSVPESGHFVAPTVIRLSGIEALKQEIFGPVLHVATFKAEALDKVVEAINNTGFGLTFGIHSRIDSRVEEITQKIKAGNIYVNRNQIGAIVGSQPFGGEGLSGTGPKAGGPNYVRRFTKATRRSLAEATAQPVDLHAVQLEIDTAASLAPMLLGTESLPGPTGESNRLSVYGRGVVLCLGPTAEAAQSQADIAMANGCHPVVVDAKLSAQDLQGLSGFAVVAYWGEDESCRAYRQALAHNDGPMVALSCADDLAERCRLERHVCVDTTAAGGNANLLAAAS